MRLTREGVQVVHALWARFEQKFGRVPGPADPVFLEVLLDVAAPIDQPRFDAAMVAAMSAAGVGDAVIHAYRRTGLLVTEHNVAACAPHALRRWQAALDEYTEPGNAADERPAD
jgi:hypothetical protein